MADHTTPDKATRDAEAEQARKMAGADERLTPEEAAAAETNVPEPAVAVHEQEMNERGAQQRGEGRLP